MTDDPYTNELLQELDRGEEKLDATREALQEVEAKWRIASVKYAALRDDAALVFGGDPYRVAEWPNNAGRGEYRYLRADVSWAVVEVLRAEGGALSQREIMRHLKEGGLVTNPRTLNAVIQGSNEIAQAQQEDEEEPARYFALDVEPDDLPF